MCGGAEGWARARGAFAEPRPNALVDAAAAPWVTTEGS